MIQLAIEDVTGLPFPEAMDRLVLAPLGMRDSTFRQELAGPLLRRAAVGHQATGAPLAGGWLVYPEMAAAGLWTTSGDLARLVLQVQEAFSGASSFLSPALASEMRDDDQPLGFDFGGEREDAFFGHDGANKGYQAALFAFQRRGQGAVVLTGSADGLSLAYELLRAIAVEYDWPAFRPIDRDTVALPVADLEALAGRFGAQDGSGTIVEIRASPDGQLRITSGYWTGDRALYPESANRFFTLEGDWDLVPVREASGQIRGFAFGPVRFVRLGE